MNADIEALRASMRASQVVGRGQYIEDGRHTLEVKLVKCHRTQIDGRWKESYIVECTVLASSNPTHEVGSTRSYVENPENSGWMSRFKGFLAAAAGLAPDRPIAPADQEVISDMIAAIRYDEFRTSKGWPENFLAGRRLTCEGMPGKARSGTPVTHKKWAPYVEAPAQ